MRILLTGYNGYIGSVLTPLLIKQKYHITGVDTHWYNACFNKETQKPDVIINEDIRLLDSNAFNDIDCVIHLAALCNDPLGELNAQTTYDINYHASIKLAALAKNAGVKRFIYASSCSLYGGSGGKLVDETAEFTPLTHYAKAKVNVEADIFELADNNFCVSCLRFATAYGYSPQLRGDLVINNLVYYALKNKKVFLKSQGLAWRPFIHVEDIARSIIEFITVREDKINKHAFNIGHNKDNHIIRDIAKKVQDCIPDSKIDFAENAFVDKRNYRVDFAKFISVFNNFVFNWSIDKGIEELRDKLINYIDNIDIDSPEFNRVKQLQLLQEKKYLDKKFFWLEEKTTLSA